MNKLSYNDVVEINNEICNEYNQTSIIINSNNILSALSVYDSYYDMDELIASALFRSLIIAHGFQDANKRTASISMILTCKPICTLDQIKNCAIDIASGKLVDVSEIADILYKKPIVEGTIKQNGKWVNKGKKGTHGTFKTKKEADAQRKAIFASGWKG